MKKYIIHHNDTQIIIMAGDVGSRFRPMSKARLPKAIYRCDGSGEATHPTHGG